MTRIILVIICGALVACYPNAPVQSASSRTVAVGAGLGAQVTQVLMPDAVTCYVATESGHGIGIHCIASKITSY